MVSIAAVKIAETLSQQTWSWVLIVAGVAAVLVLSAEALQVRRTLKVAPFVFGPDRAPSLWLWIATATRPIGAALLAGSLTALALLPPISHRKDGAEVAFEKLKHVVVVLDVSPSMRLQDAGLKNDQSRMKRAREVMESYFQRVPMSEFRVSVVAVYTDAFPVVEDTKDAGVVRNILNDLPMHFAFVPGETDLFAGIRKAADVAKGWRPRSATMILVTDGDTVPSTGMPRMPASVADVVVVGVGDPSKGSFINGKNSRQDVSTLRQIAARLGGVYHNGNEKHLSTSLIDRLTSQMEGESDTQLTAREWALLFAAIGILMLAAMPFVLHYVGTSWQPGVRRQAVRETVVSAN